MLIDKSLFRTALDVREDLGVQVLKVGAEVILEDEPRGGAEVDGLVCCVGKDEDEVVCVVAL
jgi:hypothetical protein